MFDFDPKRRKNREPGHSLLPLHNSNRQNDSSYSATFESTDSHAMNLAERTLICTIIQRAASDFLKDCESANTFFFGEDQDVCVYYFDLIDIDYDYFVEKLLALKKKLVKNDNDLTVQ